MDRAESIVIWWKTKYNLCSTDPRWLQATLTDILRDVIEDRAIRYAQEYRAHGREAEEWIQQHELDPEFDRKWAEAMAKRINEAQQELKGGTRDR